MSIYKALNNLMEFDQVIQVHADGTVTDGPSGIWAPDYRNDELDSDKWDNFLIGYTGQCGVASPMHNSEFIGGKVADDILDSPGIYVAVVCYWDCDDEECELDSYGECTTDHAEGWTVAKLKGSGE